MDLLTLPDLIRFGYVCRSWQSVSTPSRHKGRLPWLIAPFKNNLPENSSTWIDSLPFYSVLDNIFYNLDLPEIIDRRICGSSNGWLMTVHENSDIQLLHPFSRKVIDLPSLLDMPGINGMKLLNGKLQYKAKYLGRTAWEDSCLIRDTYIAKAIISATPVPLVMVSNINDELIVCRPEIDYEWKNIENGEREMFGYNDVVYCEGKFYAVLFDGSLYVVEGLEVHFNTAFAALIVDFIKSVVLFFDSNSTPVYFVDD
ncbi:hypothetical protein IFM89_032948 [Coptis chinensis]|uniref:KIB1-4 beta-propeller domain-containing protein n=1 Tax=Coptis chinensis TaxID=261450 RepID=A0A835I928_9MAGN|nr:hypothetical protein IFM89_032948 [Coptis chinensis]